MRESCARASSSDLCNGFGSFRESGSLRDDPKRMAEAIDGHLSDERGLSSGFTTFFVTESSSVTGTEDSVGGPDDAEGRGIDGGGSS